MSKTTIALEAAVATVKANLPEDGQKQTARQRAAVDKAFARILTLIAPRIRHFIRQYGLVGHWEDAEQVCSIAVHRAIEAYDPEKAQFTTFVNWQIRGELQSLRFRLMTDQRPSARKVEATTVSIEAISTGEDGEDISAVGMIEDEEALFRTEAGASAYLAEAATITLIDGYIEHLRNVALDRMRRQARPKRAAKVAGEMRTSVWRADNLAIDPAELEELEMRLTHNREVIERRLFDITTLDTLEGDTGVNKERVRQIAKRAAKTMAELAAQDPRFALMTDHRDSVPTQPTIH
ncbi:RNA polymerase subunit sigma-70 [Sphingobium lactosutens]|uniref:sigma factor n=1 Tax=Sphingobium lactosutens TaxID=522773 RepID=UPI0015BDAC37|nr:sigma factor [Sphingobium lactosutens]NWK98909.1 RNA polymerase subunit sigma-70 [Sphingobium lactosutens]